LSTAKFPLRSADTPVKLPSSSGVRTRLGALILKIGKFGFKLRDFGLQALNALGLVALLLRLDTGSELFDPSLERFLAFLADIGLSKLSLERGKLSTIFGKLSLHELNLGCLLVSLSVEETKEGPSVLKGGLGLNELLVKPGAFSISQRGVLETSLELEDREFGLEELDTLLSPCELLLSGSGFLGTHATLRESRTELSDFQFGLQELNLETSTTKAKSKVSDIIIIIGVGLSHFELLDFELGLEDLDLIDPGALVGLGWNNTTILSSI